MCKDKHQVYHCNTFRNYPVGIRYKIISSSRLCKNCLRTTAHATKDCNAGSCRTCQGKHHTLLHFQKETNNNKQEIQNRDNPNNSKSNDPTNSYNDLTDSSNSQCLHANYGKNMLLSTVILNVLNNKMSYSLAELFSIVGHS